MKKNAGMTLLEVLVAITILLLIVISVSFVLIAAEKNASRMKNRAVALGYCMATQEWLKNYATADRTASKYQYLGTYALAPVSAPGKSVPFSMDYGSKYITPLSALSGARSYTVRDIYLNADALVDLQEITVTVTWNEP